MEFDWEKLKKLDQAKSKILKYVMYKKRTEYEIRKKFENEIEEEILEEAILVLKENNYLGDINYIKRAIDEFMAIKTLSIKEIKYKLQSKGINKNLIDEYIENKYDELIEYEYKNAEKQIRKKIKNIDLQETQKIYTSLKRKGYKDESIKKALENLKTICK